MSKFTLLETPKFLLEGEVNLQTLFLHLTFTGECFTKSVYKDMLEDWVEVCEDLKARGIDEVMSFIPNNQDKVCKWQSLFGLSPFLEFDTHTMYRRTL